MNNVPVFKRKRCIDGKVVESKSYYCHWKDESGRLILINLKSPDKLVAQSKALAEVRKRGRQEIGLEPTDKEFTNATRPLAEHVAAYLQDLQELGRVAVYCKDAKRDLEQAMAVCSFRRLADIKPQPLQRWLAGQSGLADRSLVNKAKHWQMFMSWAVRNGLLAVNPLAALNVPKGEGRKRLRRSLTVEQIGQLCASSPEDRAFAYKIGFGLGLRRNEIRQLRWKYFLLDRPTPILVMPPEITKNRKFQPLSINPEFAAELRQRMGMPEDRVVKFVPRPKTLAKDLAAVGIPYCDENGRYADFHALRGTFITLMQQNGASVSVTQHAARHSSPNLTTGVYSDAAILDRDAAGFKPHVETTGLKMKRRQAKWTTEWTKNSTANCQNSSKTVAECRNENAVLEVVLQRRNPTFSQDVAGWRKIGATGFEPATSWSQTKCSTKLSYAPDYLVQHGDGARVAG